MKSINIHGRLLSFDYPKIMGVVNVTTDSFYRASRVQSIDAAMEMVGEMQSEGVDIIDIGAASSRPGAELKEAEEEWSELEPTLREVIHNFPEIPISIDTYHSFVARKAIEMGAGILNDISAFELDQQLLDVISETKTPYVLMHMKGTPTDMQNHPSYEDVTSEVLQFFIKKLRLLRDCGVNDVIIDPGFGFGKTVKQNYELFNHIEVFKILECPILVGVSRKSMIYKPLNIDSSESLNATSALHLKALELGANLLRVHDVKEAKEVIGVYKLLKNQ
ncbi:dihydropteroate synthase [Portibacter marinus]|uniref:dihydropteroate synthase n=1 Tax=Portibacter marinus TaxID=2898660 RepID=UPI001F18589D|nr:dihydropteroate synthase [Portibacter marinus]